MGCSGSYQGINNPDQQNNPPNGLNSYATNEGTPGGSNGTDIGSVAGGDATEMRWVGSAGSIIDNPNGTYGLFLSGAWAADGDSDAFNQVFYSEGTTTTNGGQTAHHLVDAHTGHQHRLFLLCVVQPGQQRQRRRHSARWRLGLLRGTGIRAKRCRRIRTARSRWCSPGTAFPSPS